jgi:uncharacterized protein (DUF427 family)
MEHVWDYPRPPAVTSLERAVRIEIGGRVLASSHRALRVLETSHPPTIYVPREDIEPGALLDSFGTASWCEYKGRARYVDAVTDGLLAIEVGWSDLIGPFKGAPGTLGW